MAYSELIKNFEAIRNYMREFYVYGFRSREEIGIGSARSYDNERRRIESWLGDYMSFHQDANGKAQFLSVDTRRIHQNPLYNAFKAKSFTDKDLILHFFLLDLLEEEWMPFRTIVDGLYSKYFDHMEVSVDMDETTIRNKLKEYVEIGLIEQRKNGKCYEYRRTVDEVNLDSWKEAIAFFTEANPLGVVGSFIQDRPDMMSDTFLFKHQYMLYALDSEVLFKLLDIISKHRKAEITVNGQKGYKYTVLPMHIYVSTQNGREYLLAHDYFRKMFFFFRLDNIKDVAIKDVETDWDKYEKRYIKYKKNMWGVSTHSSSHDRGVEHLEMQVHVDKDENYIIQRLERERRNGIIEKLDENTYRYSVDTRDAKELLPWIRTFICRIEKLSCSNREVEETYQKDLLKMYEMYGVGDTDAIQ